MAFPVHFSAKVDSIVRHSPDVATYQLVPVGRFPRFKPGQFVHLALEPFCPSAHWPESRVFSLASAPSQKFLRLTVGRQGAFTSRLLDEVQEGRLLSLKGPYGDFVISPQCDDEELVFVAGGTGITPFCSYLEEVGLNPGKARHAVQVFYGARTSELLIHRDLMERARDASGVIAIHYFVEESPPKLAEALSGRLNLEAVFSRIRHPERARFFLSGPRAMIEAFARELSEARGVDAGHIHFDSWE